MSEPLTIQEATAALGDALAAVAHGAKPTPAQQKAIDAAEAALTTAQTAERNAELIATANAKKSAAARAVANAAQIKRDKDALKDAWREHENLMIQLDQTATKLAATLKAAKETGANLAKALRTCGGDPAELGSASLVDRLSRAVSFRLTECQITPGQFGVLTWKWSAMPAPALECERRVLQGMVETAIDPDWRPAPRLPTPKRIAAPEGAIDIFSA